MKKQFLALWVIAAALPSGVLAQENIEQAFSNFVANPDANVVPQLAMERNPETGRKTSQCDIYAFTLPASKRKMVDEVMQAFERDREKAYELSSVQPQSLPVPDYKAFDKTSKKYMKAYKRAKKQSPQPNFLQTRRVRIGVGNGNSGGVDIGEQGRQYVYACFVDEADDTGTYRYAYAMEWAEEDKTISGRLVRTYAVRADKRKKTLSMLDLDDAQNISNYVSNVLHDVDLPALLDSLMPNNAGFRHVGVRYIGKDDASGWLSKFNLYKNKFIENPQSSSASFYATSIYELCKNAQCLSDTEKALVTSQLVKLIDRAHDDFIATLFQSAIEFLKE